MENLLGTQIISICTLVGIGILPLPKLNEF